MCSQRDKTKEFCWLKIENFYSVEKRDKTKEKIENFWLRDWRESLTCKFIYSSL